MRIPEHSMDFNKAPTTFSVLTIILISNIQFLKITALSIAQYSHNCNVHLVTAPSNSFNIEIDYPCSEIYHESGLTIHQFDKLLYEISEDDIADNKLSLKHGYFRLHFKYRKNCVIFVLYTNTFNGTMEAIRRSGFGTSDIVIYFIKLVSPIKENDIYSDFLNHMITEESTPFHAPIVFFKDWETSFVQGFCYFCPENIGHFHLTNASNHKNLLEFLSVLNGQSYGKPAYFISSFSDKKMRKEKCLGPLDYHQNRSILYEAIMDCVPALYSPLHELLNKLNTTIAIAHRFPNRPEAKWLLQFHSDEGILQGIPNQYALTRGRIFISAEYMPKVMACNYVENLSSFDFSLLKILDTYTLGALLAVALAYAFIYKDLFRGLDLIWLFLGSSCCCNHRRLLVTHYMVFIALGSFIYQSFISTDSMHLDELPEFPVLLKSGYRFWTDVKAFKAAIRIIPKNYLKNVEEFTGTKDLLKLAYGGIGNDVHNVPKNNFTEMVETMSKQRLFVWSSDAKFLGYALANNLMYVKSKHICKMLDGSIFFNFKMKNTQRILSYLSTKAAVLYSRYLETGIFIRIRCLRNTFNRAKLRDLQLEAVDKFRMPNPAGVKSTLGMFFGIHFCLGGVLLGVSLAKLIYTRRLCILMWFHRQFNLVSL
ncbi:unnamed protein product [Orchesella dallaii]|uniref:Uncharacterized protein n=1 Tax=Orchesella dallaii TaxID=48710 RepID=A0ABP1RPD2_9HEXA